jgi:hypothetical protein
MARAVLALSILALMAGCVDNQVATSSPSPPAQVIPWTPLTPNLTPPSPSQGPAPIPLNTPACQAVDLLGAVVGSNLASGHLFTTIGFAGVGQCYVDGTPSVGLFDSSHHSIPFRERALFYPPGQPGRTLVEAGPTPTPHTGLKRGEAGVEIDWSTLPDNCPGAQPVVPVEAILSIPAGGVMSITIPTGPGAYVCEGLGVGAFEGAYVPTPAIVVPPLPAISMQVPSSGRVGAGLPYLVTLTNDHPQALDLHALCPTYEEELIAGDLQKGGPPLGGKHVYALNCGPVGLISPGGAVTFQMVFLVPGDAARGKYTLFFGLGYWNAISSYSQATVTLK